MFTGLIETVGELRELRHRGSGTELTIAAADYAGELALGESVALDGCCLTVESTRGAEFTVFASPETLEKTTLGLRRAGERVNLERALALGARLGGHLVSGHVDATGTVRSVREVDGAWEIWLEVPPEIAAQSIPKGSITVDGISLTIVELRPDALSLWIIPETWKRTTLSQRSPGSRVNLEGDLVGKYVRRFVEQLLPEAGREQAARKLEETWRAFRSE